MKPALMRRASILAVPIAAATCVRFAMAQGTPEPTPPAATPPALPAPQPATVPPAAAPKWYEKARIEGFVDTYASINANMPKPQTGTNLGRAFDVTNGFAVHWAGLNASYAPDPVGATVGLRFGPGASIYNSNSSVPISDAAAGLQYVKQAFVAWKPGGGASQVELDFGKFDTWIGGEVADSQYNMTYTRSILFATQPLFHTGLRIDFAASEQFDLKLFAVNGWNNSLDNNSGKTFGASVGILPTKTMAFYINYIGGPEQTDYATVMGGTIRPVAGANSRWRHLLDGVADMHFDKAHVLLNADYGTEMLTDAAGPVPATSAKWYGADLTFGYAVNEMFAFALRGGLLSDPDGYNAATLFGNGAIATHSTTVVDATLTLAFMPTPNFIIKLEPRIDSTTVDVPGYAGVYPKAPEAAPAVPGVSKTMFTTTLGLVVTTN